MLTNGLFSSNTNEWATPIALFARLDAEFHFDLDPCCTHENAKCERHFTQDEDGLSRSWGGAECSAILPTDGSCRNGFASAMRNHARRTPLS